QFGALLPIELTNEEIRNSNAYKEYYAVSTGAAPPKPKASVWKTRSTSDTTITPPTAAAGVLDVPTDESEEELSWNSTDEEGDDDEGKNDEDNDGEEGDDDDDQEVKRDDEEEGGDDEQEYDEETRDGESFDPISKTPKNSNEEGNGEEDLSLNVGREEGYDEEEEEDELYKDVNINQGWCIQTTLEVEDSHVTLTPVNLDGQQQSSSVSSQFVISDHLRNEAQKENDEFLKTIDENMQKIIKEQIILDTYRETVTLKRRRDDDVDKDEEPFVGPDRGSKRRREGKEPESASAPMETATKSAGRSTQGSKS
nr:hypothetical protein [Tanacetum cinerariifolium]